MNKNLVFLDIECYRNYFLVMFMSDKGAVKIFEQYGDTKLDTQELWDFLVCINREFITFNGNNYDMPMIRYALEGKSCDELKEASDAIIVDNLTPWDFDKRFSTSQVTVNHIDLIEVAPGDSSLKLYGGRMHCQKLQDLPIEPDALISPDDRINLIRYCRNDLLITQALYHKLEGQINLRRKMSVEYGVDLRSKSDAQIAEAVLKAETAKVTGEVPKRSSSRVTEVTYTPPEYIRFRTKKLRDVLDTIVSEKMVVKDTGHVEMPEAIEKMDIQIGNTKYKIGIGGLHSQESTVSHVEDGTFILRDRDVVSYYPNLILNMGVAPESIGPVFFDVYKRILVERIEAKNSGKKVKADALKITLNGTFGKTSNKYSVLYNPELMIKTTITGQLSLLMFIELLEHFGIPVVSANTDGVVIKCPVEKEADMMKIVRYWERTTHLETEETQYKALYSRDVNNYIAVKVDGGVKTKGVYSTAGLAKNPQNEICSDAVVAYLTKGIPVEQTIKECTDIRKFLTLRRVNGGAVKDGVVLGKAIRWYYAEGVKGEIQYKTNGNTVSRSAGAKALMDLPDEFPTDVDYEWYIHEADEILMDIAAKERPAKVKLPRKNTKKWKELEANGQLTQDRWGNWNISNDIPMGVYVAN